MTLPNPGNFGNWLDWAKQLVATLSVSATNTPPQLIAVDQTNLPSAAIPYQVYVRTGGSFPYEIIFSDGTDWEAIGLSSGNLISYTYANLPTTLYDGQLALVTDGLYEKPFYSFDGEWKELLTEDDKIEIGGLGYLTYNANMITCNKISAAYLDQTTFVQGSNITLTWGSDGKLTIAASASSATWPIAITQYATAALPTADENTYIYFDTTLEAPVYSYNSDWYQLLTENDLPTVDHKTGLTMVGNQIGLAQAYSFQKDYTTAVSTVSATVIMCGIGAPLTASRTGTVLIVISLTGGGGGTFEIRYGTGTAPAINAAVTGTRAGMQLSLTSATFAVLNAVIAVPVGVTFWVDVGVSRSAGTLTVPTVSVSMLEQ